MVCKNNFYFWKNYSYRFNYSKLSLYNDYVNVLIDYK